jgi:hypothetical protein
MLKVLMLVSILILGSLGLTMGTIGNNPVLELPTLDAAGETTGNARTARQGPHVEGVAPASIPVTFVGEQNVDWDVIVQSTLLDDYDDKDGDDVLYDVVVNGTNAAAQAGNLQQYNFQTRQFENVNSPVFDWVVDSVAPMSANKNDYYLYTKGDPGMGDWKYIVNQSNSFLDEDNDKTIDPEEYWSIQTGPKTFSGFEVNIKGNAKPGYYRMKFKVDYRLQDTAPLNDSGVGNGASAILGTPSLVTNEALGPFDYYFWTANLGGANNLSVAENTGVLDFGKSRTYVEGGGQAGEYWEGIYDDGVDTPSNYFDHDNDDIDNSGNHRDMWLPMDPYGFRAQINTNYTNAIINNYPVGGFIVDQAPYHEHNGNGTWTYSGQVSEFTFTQHSDDIWFDFIINSTLEDQPDLNEDNITNDLKLMATDDDYYTGDIFEEFYLPFTNIDPTFEMRDVSAQLILPADPARGGFELYGGFDTTKVNRIDSMGDEKMGYRLSIEKDTPPGYYYGSLILKYNKRYNTGNLDPLGNPLTVDIGVTEDHWIVQFEVDYTPDLGDAKVSIPSMQVRAKPATEIDVSTGIQIFEFEIKNTGNVELWGGNKTDGNLHMQFAEFSQMGQGYYDSDADPGIELEPIDINSPDGSGLDVGETIVRQIPLKIPYHWYLPEGVYRLYLNFSGYYYNDGALGDPTGFIYMQMDWIGANDDNANRTCYVIVDKNGNEQVDAEGIDSYRMTKGIYTDIYIKKLDPKTKELTIINYTPQMLNQEELMGGSYPFSITFQNQQDYTMYNVYVEVDIEGYFDESAYYDWTSVTSRPNPKFYIDMLEPVDPLVNESGTWKVDFNIDDVDKLLPEGEHHIPIKYSYDYYEYPGAEEMSTFSVVWDTSGSPFKPYIDANANFMLNKGGSTRAGGLYDIVFVVDTTHRTSSTYRNRLRDSIDDFRNNLNNMGIDYQFALVGFNENSWVEQGFTTDATKIQSGINNLIPVNYNVGAYDAVVETIRNNFVGQQLSYRNGATKVIILHTDYYPSQGSNDETQFALAVKGEAIFFAIARTGYYYQYDLTTQNTGGQLFDVRAGDASYVTFMGNIASALTTQTSGVTPTGRVIADVPLEDVVDPLSVNMDTYGPYIIVTVDDPVKDIDTRVTSGYIYLGDEIRNINLRVELTNKEYVQYTDLDIWLPLNASDGTMVFLNPLGILEPIEGQESSNTLPPDGGVVSVTFNVDINTDIDSGIYVMDLIFNAMHDYTKQMVHSTIPVQVRVYPREPILIIPQKTNSDGEYTGSPEVKAKVTPGESFTLEFQLENVGDDSAREVFITLSNAWYEDNPFTTIEAFMTSYYPDNPGGDIINSDDSNIVGVPQTCERKLSDLGISSVTDIIDAERTLMAPSAIVPRFYIQEIQPGEVVTVKFKLEADSHMVVGKAYREWVLVEYIDSDGLQYSYDTQNQQLATQPLPIIVTTEEDDAWPDEEPISSEMLAVILIIIIIIIIILLFLGSAFNKRRMEEEERPELEDELIDEDEDMDMEEEEEEDLEDELPEELKEEEAPAKDEPDWDAEEPEEEEEEEDEDDWDIEEESKPGKGPAPKPAPRPVVAGKQPAKAPKEDNEIDDW